MLLIYQHRVYREDLKANPHLLYIFGDNLDREGMGGQAGEMRGEPNAFGIATKRSISHSYPDDYFFDTQPAVQDIIDVEFIKLEEKVAPLSFMYVGETKVPARDYRYEAIVIPLDGIGTGLSRLPETAPKLLEYINKKLKGLENL